jgi:PDZ domain-containing secreted protein
MTAARVLILVLALAAVAVAAKYAIEGPGASSGGAEVTSPARRLEAVRERAREIEVEQQRSADRADVAQ